MSFSQTDAGTTMATLDGAAIGSPPTVSSGVFVPAATAATVAGQIRRTSRSLGSISPMYEGAGSCAVSKNGKFRINGDGPTNYTCAGAGWSAPPLENTTSWGPSALAGTFAGGVPVGLVPLIGTVGMVDGSGAVVPRCTTGGCSTTLSTTIFTTYHYFEFVVPAAGPGGPTVRYLALRTADVRGKIGAGGFTDVPLTAEPIIPIGTPVIAGQVLDEWGWCHDSLVPYSRCRVDYQERELDYKAVVWARIEATNLHANLRARPATTASRQVFSTDINIDDDIDVTSELNFPSLTWRTCEGSWVGSTCNDDLPKP